jgi:hypothetical protein
LRGERGHFARAQDQQRRRNRDGNRGDCCGQCILSASTRTFLVEPLFNYNFHGGRFVGITANEYGSGQKWALPVGAVVGRVMKVRQGAGQTVGRRLLQRGGTAAWREVDDSPPCGSTVMKEAE